MLFNSIHFICFFVLVTILYYAINYKYRWVLLLTASCYFYMYFLPIYILILAATIVIDYFAGIFIERANGKKRKRILLVSIIANVGVLAIFKYYNFFIENLNAVFSFSNANLSLPLLNILLPVGLSFHTFQAMSYTIEVYRGNQKAEKHFGIYALYVMFYPQLVAGPIERPQNILHQFYEQKKFNWENINAGLKLMLIGFFLKVVIADRLSIAVHNIQVTDNSAALWLAAIFFNLQIYGDFFGYSLIALGSSRAMGFGLMQNFVRPYFATSITDFWKRWHISLSSWFRDYVYIPLGGNKVAKSKMYFNILLVFAVSGIWHGANWTFVVWGLLNGLIIIIEAVIKLKSKLPGYLLRVIQTIKVYLLSMLLFTVFRSISIDNAWAYFINLFDFNNFNWKYIFSSAYGFNLYDKLGLIFSLLLFIGYEIKQEFFASYVVSKFTKQLFYVLLITCILLFGVYENASQFIYFQF